MGDEGSFLVVVVVVVEPFGVRVFILTYSSSSFMGAGAGTQKFQNIYTTEEQNGFKLCNRQLLSKLRKKKYI